MKKYILSPRARKDLQNIREYTTKNHGVEKTKRYLSQLRDKMRMIAENPQLGTKRDDIKNGYHSFPAANHTIFFRLAGAKIEILGVPHQRMDVEDHLQ